jgi:hypothetical protein
MAPRGSTGRRSWSHEKEIEESRRTRQERSGGEHCNVPCSKLVSRTAQLEDRIDYEAGPHFYPAEMTKACHIQAFVKLLSVI